MSGAPFNRIHLRDAHNRSGSVHMNVGFYVENCRAQHEETSLWRASRKDFPLFNVDYHIAVPVWDCQEYQLGHRTLRGRAQKEVRRAVFR